MCTLKQSLGCHIMSLNNLNEYSWCRLLYKQLSLFNQVSRKEKNTRPFDDLFILYPDIFISLCLIRRSNYLVTAIKQDEKRTILKMQNLGK